MLRRIGGVTIRRALESGHFAGYLAEQGRSQHHIFGSIFSGRAGDLTVLDRFDFGARRDRLCRMPG